MRALSVGLAGRPRAVVQPVVPWTVHDMWRTRRHAWREAHRLGRVGARRLRAARERPLQQRLLLIGHVEGSQNWSAQLLCERTALLGCHDVAPASLQYRGPDRMTPIGPIPSESSSGHRKGYSRLTWYTFLSTTLRSHGQYKPRLASNPVLLC